MAVMDYQTRDGLTDYGFSIEFRSDIGWRVYIVFQPQGDNGMDLPYQSIDDNGRPYVDWRAKLDSLGDARAVAALWAELSQRHQRIQAQRRFAPAGSGRIGDELGPGEAGHGYQYDGSVIPHPRLSAKSSCDFQEHERSR